MQRDLLGIWGDALNVGNPKSYCGANPLNWNDPLGLATADAWETWCEVAAVITGVGNAISGGLPSKISEGVNGKKSYDAAIGKRETALKVGEAIGTAISGPVGGVRAGTGKLAARAGERLAARLARQAAKRAAATKRGIDKLLGDKKDKEPKQKNPKKPKKPKESSSGHENNARESTRETHERANARRDREQRRAEERKRRS